jgi:hypothetical protein
MTFTIVTCSILVLLSAFEWTLIDWLTPFLFFPLIFAAWLAFGTSVLINAVQWFRRRKEGTKPGVPLLVCAGTLATVLFVPFTNIWLWVDFHMKVTEREAVVQKIYSGHLQPNVPHNKRLIALGKGSKLSMGGNEVMVDVQDGKTYVLFFTYRGIMDSYSGFLFVPKGGSPSTFSEMNDRGAQLTKFSDTWYYASHH